MMTDWILLVSSLVAVMLSLVALLPRWGVHGGESSYRAVLSGPALSLRRLLRLRLAAFFYADDDGSVLYAAAAAGRAFAAAQDARRAVPARSSEASVWSLLWESWEDETARRVERDDRK